MTDKAPNTLTSNSCRTASSGKTSNGPGVRMPALLMRRSRPPAQRVGYPCRPGSHSLFLRDVADRQADAPAGGLLQILDLGGGKAVPKTM